MYIWELFIIVIWITSGILLFISGKEIKHNGYYDNSALWDIIFIISVLLFICLIPLIIVLICLNTLLDETLIIFFTTKL